MAEHNNTHTSTSKVIDFDYVVKALQLHSEPSFQYFEIGSGDNTTKSILDRSIMIKDGVLI